MVKRTYNREDTIMLGPEERAEIRRAVTGRALRVAKDIEEGRLGATLTRDLEPVTTGYAIGTGAVEVRTPNEILEVTEAILFIRRALVDGLRTEIGDFVDDWLGVGLWVNSELKVVTEITATIPKTEIDESTAVEIGKRLNQECIFDLDAGTEIPCQE